MGSRWAAGVWVTSAATDGGAHPRRGCSPWAQSSPPAGGQGWTSPGRRGALSPWRRSWWAQSETCRRRSHQHGPGGLQHNHSVDNFWNPGYETGGRPRTQSVSLVRNLGGGGTSGTGRSLEESGRLRTASLTSRHHRLLPSIPSFTQLASLRNRPRLASSSFRSRASSTSSSSFSSASTSSTSSSCTTSSEEFWNQYRRTPSSNLLSRLLGRRRDTLSKEDQEVKELNLSNKVKL